MVTRRKVTTKPDGNWWLKFNVKEWLTDPALSRCGPLAKGVWIQMIAHMALEPVRGVLAGEPRELALLLGMEPADFEVGTAELEHRGVLSRGKDVHERLPAAAYVCRRMFREHIARAQKVAAGRRSGQVRREKAPEQKAPFCPNTCVLSGEHDANAPDCENPCGAETYEAHNGTEGERTRTPRDRDRDIDIKSTTLKPRGSGADAGGSGSADGLCMGAEEPRGSQRVGDILRRMGYGGAAPPGGDDQEALEARVRARIAAALGAEAERRWGWWWDRVVPVVMAEPGGQHAVEDLLHELRRAGNPRTAHEHGIRDGGAWLAKGVRDWAVARGLALPVPGKPRNGVAR